MADQFLAAVLLQDKVRGLFSNEHFSVDGTLFGSLGEPEKLSAKGGARANLRPWTPWGETFHGELRSNDTHVSTADPNGRLALKGPGKEARLCFKGLRSKVPE